MTLSVFVILALSTHRLARLISEDTILDAPREWLLNKTTTREVQRDLLRGDVTAERVIEKADAAAFARWLNRLVNCQWCTSIWTGAGVVALWHYQHGWSRWFFYALALSSASGFGSEIADRLRSR